MNLCSFFFADFYQTVGDKTKCDAVRDAVAQRHEQTGEKRGYRFFKVFPVDLLKSRGHHNAHAHQSRSGGRVRDCADESSQERAEREAYSHDDAGQSRASACGDSCGALHIGGGVGSAEKRADGSGGRVGEKSLVHLGFKSGTVFHGLFIFFAEDTALNAGTDERADGVERVGNAECQDRDQHHGKLRHVRKQGRKSCGGKDDADGGGQCGAGFTERDRVGHRGDAHGDPDDSGNNDPDQDCPGNLAYQKHDRQSKADQEEPELRIVESRQCRDSGIKFDKSHVQKPYIRDKQADTSADGMLQASGNTFDDVLPKLCHGDQDIENTADKYHGQRLLPGKAETETDRVHEKGV